MNGKLIFMRVVSTIMTIVLIASLFFDEWTRAAILFGVLCLGFIAYHITGFLLIHEMDKDKRITILINNQFQRKGEWIKSNIPGEKFICSECGGSSWYYDYKANVKRSFYCPHCGAKMDMQEDKHEPTD